MLECTLVLICLSRLLRVSLIWLTSLFSDHAIAVLIQCVELVADVGVFPSILQRVLVTIDGVWIDEYIYWPLTGRNYK
jgi:hypothetical protein